MDARQKPRVTHVTHSGKAPLPSQDELEVIWTMMEDHAEDGYLRSAGGGKQEQELDEDTLRELLMKDMHGAGDAFGYFRAYGKRAEADEYNFPHNLIGKYQVVDIYSGHPQYHFFQWSE